METVIPAAIIIGLLLLAMLTMTEQALLAQETAAESWREMHERMGERNRTDISPIGPGRTLSGGSTVEITLRNAGSTKLTDFDRWDVILEYEGSNGDFVRRWYPYVDPPVSLVGENKWTVDGIHDDAFDPDILNPGEEMVITVSVTPTVGSSTTNTVTVATPNGITASAPFTGW